MVSSRILRFTWWVPARALSLADISGTREKHLEKEMMAVQAEALGIDLIYRKVIPHDQNEISPYRRGSLPVGAGDVCSDKRGS